METTKTTTTTKQLLIDASLLNHRCPREVGWILSGYRGGNSKFKTEYGTAIHKGLEVIYSAHHTKPLYERSEESIRTLTQQAIEDASDYYKDYSHLNTDPEQPYTMSTLAAVLQAYVDHYREDRAIVVLTNPTTHTPLIEQKFNVPAVSLFSEIYADRLSRNQDINKVQVNLTGTIDLPCIYNGEITVLDHKTTGSKNIEAKLAEYRISLQMMFYAWVWWKLAKLPEPPQAIINGVFIKPITARSPEPAKFNRSAPIKFSLQRMEEFEAYLFRRVNELVQYSSEDFELHPDYALCTKGYPSCEFAKICEFGTHDERATYLQAYFTKSTEGYNPLNRGE